MKVKPKLPVTCPSCQSSLSVSQLTCNTCQTGVSGNYELPFLLQLTPDEQQFVFQFVMTSGSLKEMASQMGNSYPTVRNKLDDIISKINELQQKS
ncbi:MAG: DUF2089 family protein [Fluviicola sp.]|nr:DUF2089 family protein [Fluviicola sp.]